MMHLLVTLVALAFIGDSMATWHRSQFASPLDTTADSCGRKGRRSYVCDPDNVLTNEQASQLDNAIERIANDSLCPCSEYRCKKDRSGYHIGVAVAPRILSDEEMKKYAEDMDDYRDKSNNDYKQMHTTELFAYTLLKKWELGKCEDDIIIAFDPIAYSLYTVGGRVALQRLTPDLIGDITMTNRDEFSKGTYEGLQKMLADYRLVLLNKYDGMPSYSYKPKMSPVVGGDATHVVPTALSLLGVLVLLILW